LAGYLEEESLIQFLLMSIRRNEHGTYTWRFNLAEIVENYGAIRAGLASETPYPGATLFIKGGGSIIFSRNIAILYCACFPTRR